MCEGTPPERFRVEHAHYVEDIPFWRALAGEIGGPVLDVGAAVGRVTLPLARDGHEVWPVDRSAGMLRELERSLAAETAEVAGRVHPVRADARDFALGRLFPLVIMPMNTLQALLTRDEQLACLRCVRRHMTGDGTFCFDVAVPDLDGIERLLGEVQTGATWRDMDSGVTLAHSAWFESVDRDTGTVAFTARIDEDPPGGATVTHLRPHTVHLFDPSELWELLVDAGLEVRAVYGGFDAGPLEPGSERQIYRCGVAR